MNRLAQTLATGLELLLAFVVLIPVAAGLAWLWSLRRTGRVEGIPKAKTRVWDRETIEAFPYSLGRLARILNEESSISPGNSQVGDYRRLPYTAALVAHHRDEDSPKPFGN